MIAEERKRCTQPGVYAHGSWQLICCGATVLSDRTSMYSIAEQFNGVTVLLTGATGYIGGLVLECLLRTTHVAKVYVLLRQKGSSSCHERLSKLLQSNIFHKVRNQQQLLRKVAAVEGDITAPGLGLSSDARQALLQEVNIILHCAADIRLEVDIHSALTANYGGTKAVLQLARECQQLQALVHTSSCFVNMYQPRSSVVYEQLYPLSFGSNRVDCEQLVQDLLSLPSGAADVRASACGLRWNFPNNYTFSKHLAEQLVCKYQQRHGLPAAIVRPSLVCACCYEPIPGHVGNWAGPIGASAALAIGFYHSLKCVSSEPLHVWDCMPADLVVNSIIAAAAATAAGQGTSIAAAAQASVPGSTQLKANLDSSSSATWQTHPLQAAQLLHTAAEAANSNEAGLQQKKQTAAAPAACNSSSSSAGGSSTPLLVVHSSSSSTYPLTLMEGWNHAVEFIAVHKPKFRLSSGKLPHMTPAFQPDPQVVKWQRRWTALKVAVACALLRLFGLQRVAARLRSGFEALCVYGTSKTDKDLVFDAAALQLLEACMPPTEQQRWPLVMRAGMPLPSTAAGTAATGNSTTGSEAGSETATQLLSGAQQQQQQQHTTSGSLSWRRYFHSQLAGVYSMLFRAKVPQFALGPSGVPVEHDFVFVR